MNALVKKEIRLLPNFLAVLALVILVPWLSLKDPDVSFAWTPFCIFFGVIHWAWIPLAVNLVWAHFLR